MRKIMDSYGKINLSLDVIERRRDGYHNIDTIMQLIDIKDEVTLEEIPEKTCKITCSNPVIPRDEANLVYKAWKLFQEKTGYDKGLKIHLEKRIPQAAGLAGGSSNAATVLKYLNGQAGSFLTVKDLMTLGREIGADVPYFFCEKTVRAQGIGDVFDELPSLKGTPVLILNNGREVSTKEIYQRLTPSKTSSIDSVAQAIQEGSLEKLAVFAYNSMEKVVFDLHPELGEIKKEVQNLGALYSLMSGSGATIFGVFKDEKALDRAYQEVKDKYPLVIKTRMI